MKVWIVNPYGNLPDEGWREYRSTMLAKAFNKRGHEVIWWVSNFEHRSKKFRSDTWKDIQINDKYLIRLVPSTPYSSHISLARIKHERRYAKKLREYVHNSKDRPDLIILADPSLFYSDLIIGFIRKENVPLIIDILDLWPELFHIILPPGFESLGRILFAPLYWKRAWLLRKADGIIGATRDYLAIGKSENNTKYTDVSYLGIDLSCVKDLKNSQFENVELNYYIKPPNESWVIYAGTLGKNYDISTIISCSQKIEEMKLPVKIFLAGEGDLRVEVENKIKLGRLNNLIYLGKLSASDLTLFYRNCDLALSCYVKKSTVSMPVKAFDYLAAGLPIVNSLERDLGDFIIRYNVGIQYKAENSLSMLFAIKRLVEDRKMLSEMKMNALMLAETFDSSTQSEKVVSLAEKIISGKLN
jgi:glycosyltransferase involved in cell wall biosynthesis